MADEFDPYFKWLGIPPQEQPPNHYRLLSIPLFVDDGDVIAHAADRLMGHLRTFQTGKHSLASQKLLNEISAARLCLLNVQRKAAYDAELKAKLAPPPAPSAPVAPPPVAPQPAAPVARPRPVVQSTPMPAPVPRPAPVEPLSGMTFDAPTARSKSRQARKSAARLPAWLVPAVIAAAVLAVVATVAIVMRSNSGAPQVAQKNLDGAGPVEANPAEPSSAPRKPANTPQASWKQNLPFKTEPEKTPTVEPSPPAVVEPPQGVPTLPAPPPVARVEPPQPAPEAVPIPEPKATPGKAPFDAAQAHAYQEAWAKSLGVPVVAANSLGMKLVLIPPGEFQMGSSLVQIDTALNLTDAVEPLVRSEGPQHRVVITQPFLMGSTEVTIGQYRKYVEESPTVPANLRAELTQLVAQHKLTDDTPASHLGWQHTVGFCLWLSEREKLDKPYEGAGEDWQPLPGNGYHLPTEAQWEYACRAGTETMYSHGDDEAQLVDYGWLGRNCGTFPPRAAGTRKANPFGLFDMHGNLYEWCQDTYDPGFYSVSPVEDPFHSAPGNRVVRGGGYAYHPVHLRSANRHSHAANTTKSPLLGFRVVRGLAAAAGQVRIPGKDAASGARQAANAPAIAKAPFNAAVARTHQQAWSKYLDLPIESVNSIGQSMVLLPPGEFMMGTVDAEIEAGVRAGFSEPHLRSEGPRHPVTLSRPMLCGKTEVTNRMFREFVKATGGTMQIDPANDDLPVTSINWHEAVAFCNWLSERESLTPCYELVDNRWRPCAGTGYHLPSEAQWEYACRAGTTTTYNFGNDPALLPRHAWYADNSGNVLHPAGGYPANAFGLFDLHGSVWEWTQDAHLDEAYRNAPAVDPVGPNPTLNGASDMVIRGGSWRVPAYQCRSAFRQHALPSLTINTQGFRLFRTLVPNQDAVVSIAAKGQTDLLASVDVDRDKVLGVWKREGEALITPSVTDARLQLPPPPAANYRVTAMVQRVRGNDAFVMGLVVGGQQVASTIDAPQPSRSGLANVDGKGSLYNDSKRLGAVLTTNNLYSIVHTVIDNRVVVSVNSQKIIDWAGAPKRLSLPPKLRVPDATGLFLAANSAFRITSLTVESLAEGAAVDAMDALAKLDLQQDIVAGEWKLEAGVLTSPPGIDSILLLPAPPAPDYRVTVEATRIGDHAINIGLLSGGRQFLAGIDYPQYNGSGLDLVDGKSIEYNETLRKGRWIGRDRPSIITCAVQGQRVVVTVDNTTLVDWTGAPERLSLFNGFKPFDKTRLFLCMHSAFKISRITVEPLPPPGPADASAIQQVALSKDAKTGAWKRDGDALISPNTLHSRLDLLKPPAADYEIAAEITRLEGNQAFGIGLVVGGRQVIAALDFPDGKGSGLDLVDNKPVDQNGTRRPGVFLQGQQPTLVTCTVQGQHITVTVGGNKIVDWTGEARRLSLHSSVPGGDKTRLFLFSHSSFKISRVTLRPL